MTVAIFYRGEFVDFWLNNIYEKTWIENTASSKGWWRQDLEIFWYEYTRSGREILAFDDQKNLQKIRIEETEVDGQTVKTIIVERTFNKIPVYLNGVMA